MSNSWIWLVDVVDDRDDLAALCLVVGLWGLRVLPSTRRWAPRGNIRPRRPDAPNGPTGGQSDAAPVLTSSAGI